MSNTISVIVPAFNAECFASGTLQSLVQQTSAADEIILVDDGSTDRTPQIAQSFGGQVKYVYQENSGVSGARNKGLSLASGKWVMFVDADDQLTPTAIESLLSAAPADEPCVVYGDREFINEHGNVIGKRRSPDCTGDPPTAARASFNAAPFPPGTAMVDRNLAIELGGFDARFSTCADRHFWIRCGSIARFYNCGSTVFRYRKHSAGMSRNRKAHTRESIEVQIDCIDWATRRGIELFEPRPTPVQMVDRMLASMFWSRQWESVAVLLQIANDRKLDSPTIRFVQKRRWIPALFYDLKDRFDTAIGRPDVSHRRRRKSSKVPT